MLEGVKHSRSLVPRRRRTAEEVHRILSAYRQGTLTQRQVAETNGISVGTLQNWLRRDLPPAVKARGDWIEVVTEPARPSAWTYRLEHPSGCTLVLGTGWRTDEVRDLITLLSRP